MVFIIAGHLSLERMNKQTNTNKQIFPETLLFSGLFINTVRTEQM